VIEEKRYRRRDGSVVFARVNLSVHRDADGRPQHFISVVEDITERRTLEAQVRQASKMEAIGLLASGVAHDFNNLLSVVLSYSELLAADLKDGDPMRSDLEEIKGAGLQAVQLTRQLLAFSRQQVLEPQIVDLTEIVRGMGKMLGRLIGADVQLSVTGAHALGKILVDPGQMEQVIMNLAVNARDAMPGGGKLAIETKGVVLDEISAAELVGVKPGSHVLLTVKDTGIGMDRATLARMFEPFFTTKAPGKGTGLGLATVFGIVRQSGGAIDVSSEPNVGTAFEIYFPTAHAAAVAHVSLRPSELYTLTGSETILVVENEERVRTLTCAILRKYGYTVLDAQSSGDALLTCEQHIGDIHLLLTDIVMPRMNGRQLATRLRAARPMMRVLYMSGYADSAVAHQAAEDPGFAFLQKPITPVALARKVRETLAPA
jgi:signal transduction histidine kinase